MRVRDVVVLLHGIIGSVLAGCEGQGSLESVRCGRSCRDARSRVARRNRLVLGP